MYGILICDDQPDIVNALKIYLAPEGYQLYEAFNGQQALEILQKETVHLVLLDVMMPVMDGITATARIREFSNIPIILLTAKSETEDKVLGLNVGADDYITKPFVPVEVLARVRSQLRRYAMLGSRPEDPEELLDPGEDTVPLGDMAISMEKVRAQAQEFGHSSRREVGYLTIHSMLHLLGYDHLDEGEQKAQMRKREEDIASTIPGMSR